MGSPFNAEAKCSRCGITIEFRWPPTAAVVEITCPRCGVSTELEWAGDPEPIRPCYRPVTARVRPLPVVSRTKIANRARELLRFAFELDFRARFDPTRVLVILMHPEGRDLAAIDPEHLEIVGDPVELYRGGIEAVIRNVKRSADLA